jgi:succinate-semialdehyde dehydrogenase/glutarate-semialdehyde dehydrogenase
MTIQTINPSNGHVINTYPCLNSHEISSKLVGSQAAYQQWRISSFSERKKHMMLLANNLENNNEELALLISREMGKPITLAKAEVIKCAWLCRHYAEQTERYLADKIIQLDSKRAKVCYQPLGIIFGIMPWNFPFWQALRFAVPTLMAGNAVVLKHAPITSGTGNKIEQLFKVSGFPEGLVQHFIVSNEGAAQVIANTHVKAVSLTGSGRAGQSVAAEAGKYLKKCVLELGGSDPYIVLEDADLKHASECIVVSRLSNSGQVCVAAKRVIVMKSIESQLIELIKECMASYTMGNPQDPEVKLGPMARNDLRITLHNQVEKSIKLGAQLLEGGIIPDGSGFYYPPTLLTQVKPGMPAFDEELFGPVIAVTGVATEQEAIAYANNTSYGLGAAVFTQDVLKGEYIATHEIESGVCFVNSYVASDPRLPFGGIKQSGYGRELAQEGILEFVNTKTVVVS